MAATSASWGYSGLEGKLWYLIALGVPNETVSEESRSRQCSSHQSML